MSSTALLLVKHTGLCTVHQCSSKYLHLGGYFLHPLLFYISSFLSSFFSHDCDFREGRKQREPHHRLLHLLDASKRPRELKVESLTIPFRSSSDLFFFFFSDEQGPEQTGTAGCVSIHFHGLLPMSIVFHPRGPMDGIPPSRLSVSGPHICPPSQPKIDATTQYGRQAREPFHDYLL